MKSCTAQGAGAVLGNLVIPIKNCLTNLHLKKRNGVGKTLKNHKNET
jgi:hypothetical protein